MLVSIALVFALTPVMQGTAWADDTSDGTTDIENTDSSEAGTEEDENSSSNEDSDSADSADADADSENDSDSDTDSSSNSNGAVSDDDSNAVVSDTDESSTEAVAFAVYSSDDNSLTFYYDEVPEVDDVYNGITVTSVYTGFESASYSSASSVPWYDVCTDIYTVSFDESFAAVQPVSIAYWFYNFKYCTSMSLTNLNMSQAASMAYLFYNCAKLTSIEGIESLDTSQVTSLYYTFYYCSALEELDLSNWNTSNVTTLCGTFYYCSSLSSLNVADWDVSNVTVMNFVLGNCSSLTTLNLSGWDTSVVSNTDYMFYCDSKLTTIYVSDLWSMKNVTSSGLMFSGCKKLVGGNGTAYDSGNVTDSWACIDTEANPGYLTDVNATSISVGSTSFVCGEEVLLNASVLDAFGEVLDGVEVVIAYYTDEDCTEQLEATPSEEGTYWAQVSFAGLDSYKASSATAEITIISADISNAEIELSDETYDYDGTARTPSVTVVLNNTTLTEGSDYEVAYSNNTDAGTATVTVTGIGIYTGTATVTFTIVGIDIADATVTLPNTSYSYTGGACTPTPTVKYSTTTITKTSTSVSVSTSTVVLTQGVHYTVSYSDNVEIGTATITITGVGAYEGTLTTTFEITAASISDAEITLSESSYAYDGGAKEPAIESVVLDGVELIEGTDYELTGYSNNTSAGTATVTITGIGNYTGEASATFTIGALDISDAEVTLAYDSVTYSGSAKKPSVTVILDDTELVQDTDYTVAYSDNTNVGTATVTITGIGNYAGEASATFTIKQKSISSFSASLSTTTYTYNGQAKKPSVTLKNGSTKIAASNYSVTYASGRKSIGKYKVTIKGTGNYTGTKTLYFKINPKKVSLKSSTKSSAKKKLTVKWSKVSGSVSKYQIRYRVKGTSKWTTKTVSSSKSSYTISKLKSKKKYQVQVRAYKTVSGTKYYGSWSSAKTVTVK